MRSIVGKLGFCLLLLVTVTTLLTGGMVAKADGGGSPFSTGDSRVNPLAGDRVAVYCNANNIDVWGIDTSNNGVYLTTFTLAELKQKATTHTSPNGTVTLNMDSAAQTHMGYITSSDTSTSLIVDQGTQYRAVWTGGNYGADGNGVFFKTFSCTYLGG
ncbi:MAG: hypothetical protein IT324_32615 [Anaerolineae bacterium]|nr:hypothetical protein [Anaerolineae bacterium]